MENEIVMFPAKILSASLDDFQGNKYYTLNVIVKGTMMTMTGKADFDFSKTVNEDVVLSAEIRGKAKGNSIRPDLRAISADVQKAKPSSE